MPLCALELSSHMSECWFAKCETEEGEGEVERELERSKELEREGMEMEEEQVGKEASRKDANLEEHEGEGLAEEKGF